MGFFSENYTHFKYPIESSTAPGFRSAQLGAIHACAAHFVTRTEPGIVTMPTGSGKTSVLIAAAFVLRAQRVLIITPSRLVREQIALEVESLKTLRTAGAIGAEVPAPKVFSTKTRLSDKAKWEALRSYDVVVGTIQSISPEQEGVEEAPEDMFDLVLVDEAHHSPARTWQALLDHFKAAKRLLFTATPFRQDQREIKGRFIFTYDLKRAFEDKIFGEIAFAPVTPNTDTNSDVAIAQATEAQYRTDKANGFNHHIMVRTDSRKRAITLDQIYSKNTGLRLKIITGDRSLKYVQRVISALEADKLDGIICVNMLGEGFNFPSLKIAAIHSPHRSLSVTLQFIGRFARTSGENIGKATFLAVPSEIEIQAERLYDTNAVWQDLVQNLSATRIADEAQTRDVLDTFETLEEGSQDLSDLSLYALDPYYHVKVYQLTRQIDLRKEIIFPAYLQTIYSSVSEAHNAAIYITKESSQPRWTNDDRLSIIQPDLFIFHQDQTSMLLYICASRRSEGLYTQLSEAFIDASPKPLPLIKLNRALNDLKAPEFFNVGMRNRVASSTNESYRIVTGSSADKAILKSDGRLYHRGHVFGRGTENGDSVTIGLSSASKIWSNKSSKLPALIAWCEKLSRRISSQINPSTGSGLDYLDVGEEISVLPDNIIAADWPASIYKNPPHIIFGATALQLLDCDITVEAKTQEHKVLVRFDFGKSLMYRASFSFETDRFFEPAVAGQLQIEVQRDRNSVAFIDFLNEEMMHFYMSDLSLLDGYSLLRAPSDKLLVFDDRAIETLDWESLEIDITSEFEKPKVGKLTIHGGLETLLAASECEVVYYDHGTGEVADFVAVQKIEDRVLVQLYHCKGATGKTAGHRLADVYEVTSQAVKSVTWTLKQRMLANIRRRFNERKGSCRFIRGDIETLASLLNDAAAAQIDYEFIAVQPGVKKSGLPAEFAHLLAAASDHLIRGGFKALRILASE